MIGNLGFASLHYTRLDVICGPEKTTETWIFNIQVQALAKCIICQKQP